MGRKSFKEEIQAIRYIGELVPDYFAFLKEMLTGEDKKDKKWASDQMNKLVIKTIPQDITTGGEAMPQPILNYVQSDNSNEEGDKAESENTSPAGGDVSE